MEEHHIEPAVPMWRVILCVFFWCFSIVGAIFAVSGDLILHKLGVISNTDGPNGLRNIIYMLGIYPVTTAVVVHGMRPIRLSGWKRAFIRICIIALVGMGVVPNQLALLEIAKWRQIAEAAPIAWLRVVFLCVGILTGKCLILFYWWRVTISESAKILGKTNRWGN